MVVSFRGYHTAVGNILIGLTSKKKEKRFQFGEHISPERRTHDLILSADATGTPTRCPPYHVSFM